MGDEVIQAVGHSTRTRGHWKSLASAQELLAQLVRV